MHVPDHVSYAMFASIHADGHDSHRTEAASAARSRSTPARWLGILHKITLGVLLGTVLSSGGLSHTANIEAIPSSVNATLTAADSVIAGGQHVLGQPRVASTRMDTVTASQLDQRTGAATKRRIYIPVAGTPARSSSVRSDDDLVVDNHEPTFTSVGRLYEATCGEANHSNWTWASNESDGITNDVAAVWRPEIPEAGHYKLLVHIPSCSAVSNLTTNARYEIAHASGKATVTINQSTQRGWVELGSFGFTTGTGGYVRLTDLTSESYYSKRAIVFDAIKWVPTTESSTPSPTPPGPIDLSKYPTEFAANSGYVYTGRRAQVLHYLQEQFSIRITTYATHSECPTCSADFWTPGARGGVDNTGMQSMNDLAEFIRTNLSPLGMRYVIWDQQISTGGAWRDMEDRGGITANHKDHIHITFLDSFR